MKKRRLKKFVPITFIILFLIGIVFSIFKITEEKVNIVENNNIKKNIEEFITVDSSEQVTVDFNKLKEQNSDVVAYIDVSNTDAKYVVVKGSDNDFYLRHNFNRGYNVAGWIFADYRNRFDGTDRNIIVYGHNMQDGSMFGSLKKIITSEWQNQEQEILFITEYGTFKYKPFSVYIVDAEDYYLRTDIDDEYIRTVSGRSYHNFGISITGSDDILTLSTCTGTGNKRIVLQAKKVEQIG